MDDTTRALLDRAELDEVMNRYAASIDLRDWARLRTVFVDEIDTGHMVRTPLGWRIAR